MLNKVISQLSNEGYKVEKKYLCTNNKGKPNKASSVLVFPRYKTAFVVFKKYYEDGVKAYPSNWNVYSIGNPCFYKTPEDLKNHIKRLLGQRVVSSPNIKDIPTVKRTAVPSYVLNIYSDENKKNPTVAEDMFRQRLNFNNVPFMEQVPLCNKYIVDFLLFNKIVVEIDGGYHNTNEQKKRDKVRTKELNKAGYLVVRCTNKEVEEGVFAEELIEWLTTPREVDIPCWGK